MSDYILTSSMQANRIVAGARESLTALARDDFRSAVSDLYRGLLEKQRLQEDTELKLISNAATGTADAAIVDFALERAHSGWRRLSLAATGDRRLGAWDSPTAKLLHRALYSYVHGFIYSREELRPRYAAAVDGAMDDLIAAALSDPDMPLEFAAELIVPFS